MAAQEHSRDEHEHGHGEDHGALAAAALNPADGATGGEHCGEHAQDDGHGHGHGRGDHAHRPSAAADGRWLAAALAVIAAFMVVEVIIGLAVNSLALLSDAAHMLTDAGAIALALVAMRLARGRPRGGFTYGLRRAEILSAQANGITLLLLAGLFAYEAIRRLVHPSPVGGLAVLLTALVGIVVNLCAAWLIRRADRRSLNVEGAYQHIVTDLAAFVATAIAGVLIITLGWRRVDAIASLVVVVLMVRAGFSLVRESGRILLEAAPAGLDPGEINREMTGLAGVVGLHDLHVWEITSGAPALSAHVIVAPVLDCHRVRLELESMLRQRYGLTHTTLQVDHAPPTVHRIGPT